MATQSVRPSFVRLLFKLTLKLQQETKTRFVVWWRLADMGGEDGLGVLEQITLLQAGSDRVADGVDFVLPKFAGGRVS